MNKSLGTYNLTDRLRDIVADNPLLLPALSRFGISLGFGDRTVEEVCRKAEVDARTVVAVFNFISGKLENVSPEDISVREMVRYLKSAHSYFLDYQLPGIRRSLLEAVGLTSDSSLAIALMRFYDQYVEEVRRHMDYENTVVFGYVNALLEGTERGAFSIARFRDNHSPIAEKLKELKDLLVCHFTADGERVDLLNTLLFDLVICERDLIAHCLLEDRIFIPAIERLEASRADTVRREQHEEVESKGTLDDNGDILLTPREKDIITCIARGMQNKEIADKLCLSVHTVTTHRRNISAKLDIHSTSALTIFALLHGYISLEEGQTLLKMRN